MRALQETCPKRQKLTEEKSADLAVFRCCCNGERLERQGVKLFYFSLGFLWLEL